MFKRLSPFICILQEAEPETVLWQVECVLSCLDIQAHHHHHHVTQSSHSINAIGIQAVLINGVRLSTLCAG
jgi:hypothetical protein